MQDKVHVRVESPAFPAGRVEVQSLEGRESISKLFQLEVAITVRGTDELDEDALLSSPAELIFERESGETRIFGMIAQVVDNLESTTAYLTYTLLFVPRAWRMGLTETSEVFLDQSVIEIVTEKLANAGLVMGEDVEFRLRESYPQCEFVVQYKETDLAFVSRLTEHHGISFFFEHRDEKDVLVFVDHNEGFARSQESLLMFTSRGDRIGIFGLEKKTRAVPGRCVVKDYNYRTPGVSLMASASVSGSGGEVVEYGGHFKTLDEAQRFATIRAEEVAARRTTYNGRSDVAGLRAGCRFKLVGHHRADGEFLVTEVRQATRQVTLGMGTEQQVEYSNEFVAIPIATRYRPARETPKPRVSGVINGVVEAAAKGEYAEVDAEGRYRVRFMFDTGNSGHGRASRPIRMAQPHAGPGSGFHFPLRDGVEVLLTCVDGDPDRPIISGAVPNPATPSTVAEGNSRRNVIRTGGGSEINIDDSNGSTRLKMSIPYANTVFQLGAPNLPGKGAVLCTGADVEISAGGAINEHADRSVTLKAGTDLQASAGMSVFMDAADDVTVNAGNTLALNAPIIDVTAKDNLNEKAPWIDIVGGNKIRAGAPLVEINGGSKIQLGAPTIEMEGDQVALHAGANLDATGPQINVVGGAKVRVSAPLVELNAPTVLITGTGAISIKGGTVKIDGSTVTIKGGTINLNS